MLYLLLLVLFANNIYYSHHFLLIRQLTIKIRFLACANTGRKEWLLFNTTYQDTSEARLSIAGSSLSEEIYVLTADKMATKTMVVTFF